MMRKSLYMIGGVAGTAIFLAGCGNGQSTGGQGALPTNGPDAYGADEVPTVEEAEEAVAAEITQSNAEQALRDLEAELEAELNEP